MLCHRRGCFWGCSFRTAKSSTQSGRLRTDSAVMMRSSLGPNQKRPIPSLTSGEMEVANHQKPPNLPDLTPFSS